jgi:hypothetical protein
MCGLEYTREKCPLLMYTTPELQDPFAELVANRDWLSVVSGRKLRVLKRYKRPAKPAVSDVSLMMSDAAIKRWRHEMKPAYRPAALKRFAKFMDENAQN